MTRESTVRYPAKVVSNEVRERIPPKSEIVYIPTIQSTMSRVIYHIMSDYELKYEYPNNHLSFMFYNIRKTMNHLSDSVQLFNLNTLSSIKPVSSDAKENRHTYRNYGIEYSLNSKGT